MRPLGGWHRTRIRPRARRVGGGRRRLRALAGTVFDRVAAWPRWTGRVGALGVLSATLVYGIILGGYLPSMIQNVTASMGFSVSKIHISGQKETDERDVIAGLDFTPASSLVMYDVEAARQRLMREPWIDSVSVLKLYPDTLRVTITERHPFALWQRGRLVSIIDRDGNVITDHIAERFTDLPLIVGHGGQRRAAEILALLARFPTLKSRVRASALISRRRWNLILENGIQIQLPERDPQTALRHVLRLDAEKGLLSRDIAGVDMRLADRVVIRLTDEAASRRKARIEGKPVTRDKEADT